jgi:NADH-quinone oxidoreductase subunit J
MEQLFFYIFAAIAVISALGVISVKNPVHSAIYLIACLLQVAAIFILLRSPFLAAVQVFIYVGAVVVLFLFAVMMLDIGRERLKEQIHGQKKIAVPAVILLLVLAGYLVLQGRLSAPLGKYTATALAANTEILGRQLYTRYIFSFEVVSVLLLVALIGAIILIIKQKE